MYIFKCLLVCVKIMTFKPQTGICSDFYSEMGQIYFALLFFFGKQQNFITIQIRIEIRKLKINTEKGNSSLPWVIVKFKILDYCRRWRQQSCLLKFAGTQARPVNAVWLHCWVSTLCDQSNYLLTLHKPKYLNFTHSFLLSDIWKAGNT